MTEIDGAKDEIAYLKLWLGIMVATGISLIGWLLGNFRSAPGLLVGDGFAELASIGCGCFALPQRIKAKIDEVNEVVIMEVLMTLVLIGAAGFLTYLASSRSAMPSRRWSMNSPVGYRWGHSASRSLSAIQCE